jgi:CheY-like chemotaxis protein
MTHQEIISGRTALQLLQDQLDGVTAWQTAARAREVTESARRDNREVRVEARRRLEALRRVNAAVLARADAAIIESVQLFRPAPPRAVVVHRQDWMREKLTVGLMHEGVAVIAEADDGADALGISIAEQPDLVVLEDRLPSFPAVDVILSLREFAPRTVLAAQVESDNSVGPLLEAGAVAVFNRRVAPGELCCQLVDLLRRRLATGVFLT